jgi:hypothetical protein
VLALLLTGCCGPMLAGDADEIVVGVECSVEF